MRGRAKVPLDAIFSAADYDYSRFTSGVTPRLPDGGVENTPVNAILSQWLRELEADGTAVGWSKTHVPVDEGCDVFIGETIASMTKYNREPINPEDDAFQFNKPIVGSSSPPGRGTPDIALLEADPDSPTVKKVASTDVGYPQGTYLAAKTIVGKSKKTHTLLSPTVQFTVSSNGQDLEWQAAQDLPEEAYGEGLWLSKPVSSGSPDPSTMRLQAVRKKGPRTHTIQGPLKLGTYARKAPTRNETKVGEPRQLKRARDYPIRGGHARDLQEGRYQFSVVVTTALGESLPSQRSEAVEINKERNHHAFVFSPERLHPDATGYKIFAMADNVVNPPWYQLIRVHRTEKSKRFNLKEKPSLYGYIDSGDGSTAVPRMPAEQNTEDPRAQTQLNGAITASDTTVAVDSNAGFPNAASGWTAKIGHEIVKVTGGGMSNSWTVQRGVKGTDAEAHADNAPVVEDDSDERKEKRDRAPHRLSYILVSADPPTEDTTGIEDPTGDIDAPLPVGIGRPAAGTYYVSYCRRFDGKPTQSSKPVKVTITSSEVIELRFPPRVNKLFNALYGQLSQKGIPSGWTFTKQDGTTYTATDAQISVSAGKVTLKTSGAPSLNNTHPRAVSYDTSDALNTLTPASRDRLERLRGTLEVSGRSSGRGYIELLEIADDGSTVLATTSLGTLVTNGYLYVNETIGDSSLSPDISLNAATSYLAIRWGIENGGDANRNLAVAAYSLFLHPFNGEPRAFEERSSPDELWQPSLDPATPVPGSHVLAIGPPPPAPGDIAAITPLDTVDHTTGTVVVGSGNLPTNWVKTENNPGANSEATIAATTVFTGASQNAAKFRSDALNVSNNNYFQRDYTGTYSGTSMGVRVKLYIERLPTKEQVRVVYIGTASNVMAYLRLSNSGNLVVFSVDKDGKEKNATIASGLSATTTVEVELLVGGGGTSSGNVSTSVGINGATRSPAAGLSGINYTGRNPRVARYGAFSESRSDMKWTLWYDDVIVTESGYTASLPAPVSGTTPTTDRPLDASSDPRALAVDGDIIEQGYAFFLASDVLKDKDMGHEVDEYFVFPGVQRTAAIFLKPSNIPTGMRIFVLAAYNAAGERVELGCLSEQTGANAVANATAGWYEYWMTYTAPEGYFRLRWEHEGTTGGSYVYQEPLDEVGNLNTLALRDAKRSEAKSTTGVFSVLLHSRVPDTEGTNMENGWLEERQSLNVVSEVPDALTPSTAVTYRARATDVTPPTSGFSSWETDLSLVPDYEWIELEVTLTGDGVYTPVIPSGGANVIYSTYQPILLREDRTALSGGVLIGGDSSSNLPRAVNRHEYDTDSVGGLALARAVTDRIKRLRSYGIRVYTPEAEDEVATNLLMRDEYGIPVLTTWVIEDWYEDLVQSVRLYGESDFEPEQDYDVLDRKINRRVPRVMTIEASQVLEAGALS